MTTISIGILAWNEESSIGATIASLAQQDLFSQPAELGLAVEIIVVPNGCSDGTAQRATEALRELAAVHPLVHWRVEELAEGNKINAWNHYVHRCAAPGADYMILLDADIELLGEATLRQMWQALEATPHALIATDTPVKHLVRKQRLTPIERLLLGAGEMTQSSPGQLTGQLYCARAAALREIVIPRGLIADDGFLKQVVCTRGFAQPVDNSRIVRAEGARHMFECYTRPADIWNHQVRQAAAQKLYELFDSYVRTHWPERPVFDAMREASSANPDWFAVWAKQELSSAGPWVMNNQAMLVRWRRIRFGKGTRRLKFLSIAAAALPIDVAVYVAANARLRGGRIKGLWRDTRTTTLSKA